MSEGTRAKFNATFREKNCPLAHSGPVWLSGCNTENSSQCSSSSIPSLPTALKEGRGQNSVSIRSLPRSKLHPHTGGEAWVPSRVAPGLGLPCPSHLLWLQIRSDWGRWVLLDITEGGGRQGTEKLQGWEGTGGERSPSLHVHANTCLKHIGHTSAVV